MRGRINHSACTNTQVATVGAASAAAVAAAGTDVADRAAAVAAGVAASAVRLPIAVAHRWRR